MISSRRNFLKASATIAAGVVLEGSMPLPGMPAAIQVPVDAHLWVYASRFPPDWDCTPILPEVFSDLKYAGYDKVELMESVLKHADAVNRINALVKKHHLPVTGTSYYGDMWDETKHQHILEDVELVAGRLRGVGGTMIGLTVGDARRQKTERELDTQAATLKRVIEICKKKGIEPNLHNHTFEVSNGLHDLRGTVARIPAIKLGPDLNWLVRGGVDPVWFIKTYGSKMVYMHIRDQGADGKWTEAVGEGLMDFPAIAAALKAINYNGRAAVELAFDAPATRPVREDWRLSRQYVKRVFGW